MGAKVREYVQSLPLRPGTTPLKFAPDYEKWLIGAMSHGDYDDFWKSQGFHAKEQAGQWKDVPTIHSTGWYDSWGTPVTKFNWAVLSKTKKTQQHLLIGPWIHSGKRLSYAGMAQFTPDAALPADWQDAWFAHYLRGVDNGVEKWPPVRIYVMGGGDGHKTPEGRIFVGGRWRDEKEWPLARTKYTDYYLHPGGVMGTEKPRANAAPVKYLFDPKHPVPTLGGNVSSQGELMFQGAADQRCRPDWWLCADQKPLSSRNDVLVFQTPPLGEDLEVTGPLVVKLWAASDGKDTDFTAKLIDVYPPSKDYPAGVDLNVGDSIVRARYRKGPGKAEFLIPGQPQEFTIELYPTSLVFQKGHRIRVDISSSNFPRFDVNPNTGEPLNDNRRTRVAENTIYLDAAHPSRIVLPVIPR
jgi:putative CocE/NonD family hydrolase